MSNNSWYHACDTQPRRSSHSGLRRTAGVERGGSTALSEGKRFDPGFPRSSLIILGLTRVIPNSVAAEPLRAAAHRGCRARRLDCPFRGQKARSGIPAIVSKYWSHMCDTQPRRPSHSGLRRIGGGSTALSEGKKARSGIPAIASRNWSPRRLRPRGVRLEPMAGLPN